MKRLLQSATLLLSLGLLVFLACRAQNQRSEQPLPATKADPVVPAQQATVPDAAPPDAPPARPDYLPASKSGGAFLRGNGK